MEMSNSYTINSHSLDTCTTYISKSEEERVALVKEYKACWSCLKIGHISLYCRNKSACNTDSCGNITIILFMKLIPRICFFVSMRSKLSMSISMTRSLDLAYCKL